MVVGWSGPAVVGLAVNVLHFDGSDSDVDPADVKAAYQAAAGLFSPDHKINIPNTGDVIDDATGTLVRTWTGTGGGLVTGSSGGNYAAGVGACVTWLTGSIVDGKRLRGRTFIVPVHTAAWDTDGTFTTSAFSQVQAFADAMLGTTTLGIWHRPTTPGGSDGTSGGVVGYHISDRAAYLSSRRD